LCKIFLRISSGTDFNKPPPFNELAPNYKSDIVRIYCLHKYGGFWIDTDVIIIKDLNKQWNNMVSKGRHAILDIELNISQKYIDNLLDSITKDLLDKKNIALNSLDTIVGTFIYIYIL
jgi:hypothetical protein